MSAAAKDEPGAGILLHIAERDAWERTQESGAAAYRPASLLAEGFIHLSTPGQALLPANAFYRGRTGLVLLVLDAARLDAEVRYEPADGHWFPHLYGPLNGDAVTKVLPFPPESDGSFRLPPELSAANAD